MNLYIYKHKIHILYNYHCKGETYNKLVDNQNDVQTIKFFLICIYRYRFDFYSLYCKVYLYKRLLKFGSKIKTISINYTYLVGYNINVCVRQNSSYFFSDINVFRNVENNDYSNNNIS